MVSHYFSRSATIPNALGFIVPRVAGGRGCKRFIARPLTAARKTGGFVFTRKPYVFPSRKRGRVK